jgi:ATP adenylyltransferase
MKFLYVPWRSKYVKNSREVNKENSSEQECVFCLKLLSNEDRKNFILARHKYNFIILNLHPYNAGHIMVLPLRHIKNINEMTQEERKEFIDLLSICTIVLQKALNAEGINVGMNLGKAAGAGIPAHLHMHIIPRWIGDTNFLPVISQTKTISMDLNKIFDDLKQAFDDINL